MNGIFILGGEAPVPQVLKPEVETRIRAAARELFAQQGYAGAGIAQIARRAGISPGNVYRYFADKEALFAAVLPDALVQRIRRELEAWLESARTLEELSLTAPDGEYRESARSLLELVSAHRLELVIVLGQASGTPWAAFPEETAQLLVRAALRQLTRGRARGGELPPPLRFALEEVQRSYVWALVRILETFAHPEETRQALAGYERYHVAGLRALLPERPAKTNR